jgi:hypothetical protein
MPMYYFHMYDDKTIVDSDGTDLDDIGAARDHAAGVARELTTNSHDFLKQSWSAWTMRVHDGEGTEVFSLAMSGFGNGNSRK